MNVLLTRELKNFVQEKVKCGEYASASEVIRASLHLMYAREHLKKQRAAQLNREIERGLGALDRKEFVDGETSRQKMRCKISRFLII